MNKSILQRVMARCPQTETQNVLQHGLSVARYFKDLHDHLTKGTPLKYEWKLPEWCYEPCLLENILPLETIYRYQIYHDCGKPFCIEYDDQGRRHFPNHAEWSYKIWKQIGTEQEARLMKMDMDLHLMKSGEEKAFAEREEAATLLLTSLCEIHSNAQMFGGIDSTSFKIKWKKLNKFGKRITNHITGDAK